METGMLKITTWDELLDAGIKALTDEISTEEISFGKELVLQIRVEGPTWDEHIDYRGAQYIVDLQKAVSSIYKELSGSQIPLRDLNKLITVKVRVEKGSQILEMLFGATLENIMSKLTGKEILLIAGFTVACATGGLTYTKTLDIKHKTLQQAEDRKLKREYINSMNSTIEKALDIIERKELEAPPRKFVSKLGEKDTIQLPGKEAMAPEKVMKQMYPKKPRMRPESEIIDGPFVITQLNMEKAPVQFKLKKDGHEFWADAELSNTDIERISQNLKKALQDKEEFSIDLRLFVVYDKKKMRSASIQGTGAPRTDSKRFVFLTSYWEKNK